MARTSTLSQLIAEVRNRGEFLIEYFSDEELAGYINESIAELYDLIVSVCQDYYLSSASISVVAGTQAYSLPSDFYKLLGLDYVRSNSERVTLRRYMWAERNDRAAMSLSAPEGTRYRVMGSSLYLEPSPSWAGTLTLWYIPAPARLTIGTDTFDGISGWQEYVVLDACIKCAAKEESDTQVYMQQKSVLTQRVITMASDRDAGEADRVRNYDQAYPVGTYLNP